MGEAVKKMEAAEGVKPRRIPTEKQLLVITSLLAGQTEEQAAKAGGVSRQTVSHWLNNDVGFISALEGRRGEIWNDARNTIRETIQAAIAEFLKATRAGNFKAAQWILERTGFDEIAKEEFASLKSRPVSVDDVLGRFATAEANRNMQGIMKRPPDSLSELEQVVASLNPPAPETPEQKRYKTLWRGEFDKALSRLQAEYVDDDDDTEEGGQE